MKGVIIVKDLRIKWLLILGIILLLFLSVFVFLKLAPIWLPVVHVLKIIVIPFIISGFITYLLHPLVEKIHHRGVPRAIAILFIYIFFFGGLGFGIYRGIPLIITQLRELIENFPTVLDTYRVWLGDIHNKASYLPEGLHSRIEEGLLSLEEGLDYVLNRIIESIKTILSSILLLAIIPFIVFYMLKDFDEIKKAIWYVTPRKFRKSGQLFIKDVDESLGNYIRGQLIVCLAIGIIASIALWLFGMKYPLLLGIIIGLTNVIPYFGPLIGAIPAGLIAATISIEMVIIVVSIIFVLQFIEGNLLSPLIVGKSLHMHPLMIMAALLIGGEVGGVIGLIIAVPLLAIFKVIIIHAKSHFMHRYKES
ncbi:AI-2E family transporter [Cytobacillus suaedae]|nr:AI-2E family transporter [Cytobacillus suaedae]